MGLEGVGLHLGAGQGELAHGGVGRGGGGVAAAAGNAVFQIQHPLFRDADQPAGLLHAGEHIFHHGAALVQHQSRLDALLRKPVDDVDGPLAVDLLAAGEGEIDVVFRGKALPDQVLRRGQDAVEGHFRIQRAPAPHGPVPDDGGKGRHVPVFLLHRHHIVVSHQHGRLPIALALPGEEQGPVLKAQHGAGFCHVGVELRHQGDQLFKLPVVLQTFVRVGDGAALYQLGQGLHRGVLVKIHLRKGCALLHFGLEGQGAQQNHRQQQSGKAQYHNQNNHLLCSSQQIFLIQDAGHPKGEQHAHRHHDAHRARVQGGDEDEQNQHQQHRGHGDLPVL